MVDAGAKIILRRPPRCGSPAQQRQTRLNSAAATRCTSLSSDGLSFRSGMDFHSFPATRYQVMDLALHPGHACYQPAPVRYQRLGHRLWIRRVQIKNPRTQRPAGRDHRNVSAVPHEPARAVPPVAATRINEREVSRPTASWWRSAFAVSPRSCELAVLRRRSGESMLRPYAFLLQEGQTS
jgi:hypothetical protein